MPPPSIARILRLAACVAISALVSGANAQQTAHGNGAGIEWHCWQGHDRNFHVTCLPRPGSAHAMASEDAAGGVRAVSPVEERDTGDTPLWGGGGMFRSPVRAPIAWSGVPRDGVHAASEGVGAKPWQVPLYVRPSNPAAVTRLLEIVLCREAPACSVAYRPGVQSAAF